MADSLTSKEQFYCRELAELREYLRDRLGNDYARLVEDIERRVPDETSAHLGQEPWRLSLPVVTVQMLADYGQEGFFEQTDKPVQGVPGVSWSQAAVDFACMLQSRLQDRFAVEPDDAPPLTCDDVVVENLRRTVAAKQAKIDALMLEFCPGEMSAEQREEWAKHQQGEPLRRYHANGTYWSGVPTIDLPCDFCERGIMEHDPRTHACLAGKPEAPQCTQAMLDEAARLATEEQPIFDSIPIGMPEKAGDP